MRQYLLINRNFEETDSWTAGCWVNIECPDNDDFALLTERLHIPEEVLTYTSDVDERPRIELDGPWVLTILRIPVKDGTAGEIITVPIGIITGNDVIVTICYHRTEILADFIAHCRTRGIVIDTKSTFILHLIMSSAFWYMKYLKSIYIKVNEASRNLETSIQNSDLVELMKLQQTLVYFNTSLRGNDVLIARLHHVFTDNFDMDLLEDVEIELKQALNTVNVYTEILGGTLDTFASVISNNVNAIMKRMTGITIVLMIPTLIASFYGMNVDIGLSGNPNAFWIIVVVAALLTVSTFLLLRRIKWF